MHITRKETFSDADFAVNADESGMKSELEQTRIMVRKYTGIAGESAAAEPHYSLESALIRVLCSPSA